MSEAYVHICNGKWHSGTESLSLVIDDMGFFYVGIAMRDRLRFCAPRMNITHHLFVWINVVS